MAPEEECGREMFVTIRWEKDGLGIDDVQLRQRDCQIDSVREQRILMEVVVDAYAPDERAMGWYYYLEGKLNVPFTARCTTRRAVSPLRVKDEVEVNEF